MTSVGSVEDELHERELVARIRAEVADELSQFGGSLSQPDRRELSRQLVIDRLRHLATERLSAGRRPLEVQEERRIAQAVFDSLFGLGRLQSLVDDERIENIDVNGCDQVWVTYSDGTKRRVGPVADSDAELIELIRSAAARFGLSERRFDNAHPELDLRLPDGSRLSALMAVVTRPSISIRRHRYVKLTLSDLVEIGSIDVGLASFLAAAVKARKNIVVAGAMASGKTTLVRALAAEIPPWERVITIEQAFELALDQDPERHPDLVALEAREANSEGEGALPMSRLVRRALRMNADRVIVGEVLGDEVLPMLNAMSQGRSGSMCTIHADSSAGAFRRIAAYAVQAPQRLALEATNLLIAGALHFVVFLDFDVDPAWAEGFERTNRQGSKERVVPNEFPSPRRQRFVSSVREVIDADGLQVISNEIFAPGPGRRAIPAAPLRTSTLEELADHGFDPGFLVSDRRVPW